MKFFDNFILLLALVASAPVAAAGVLRGSNQKQANPDNETTQQRELTSWDIPDDVCESDILDTFSSMGRDGEETYKCGDRIKYMMTPHAYNKPKVRDAFQDSHYEGKTGLTVVEACQWIRGRKFFGSDSCDCSCKDACDCSPTKFQLRFDMSDKKLVE